MSSPKIQRALISVSDKQGLAEFAQGLAAAGVQLYSTGGTAAFLREQGLTVHDISAYTGFPEMMDGRLKTLHPKVFGGLLCRHDRADDMESLAAHDIVTFELVVVNLYAFEATIAKPGVTDAEAIEKIDIGGPSLVRAAAKNHAFTTIATSADQYGEILAEVQRDGCTSLGLRRSLARAAFEKTAAYDRAIADYFARPTADGLKETIVMGTAATLRELPANIEIQLHREMQLRYGENPHQAAAAYRSNVAGGPSLLTARQLNGKELSYNNLLDLDAALTIARSLPMAAASVIKHNNPCGAASAPTLADAVRKALAGDPISAFGSIIGFNRPVDGDTAEVLCEPGLFIEAVVAPSFDEDALILLRTRPKWRANVRLMEVGALGDMQPQLSYRPICGGVLVQEEDLLPDPESEWKVVTTREPDASLRAELQFSWALVRHVKSNAIVVTRDLSLCGAGAGQMSRVDSVEIALSKSGDRARGAVLASDAFFPFPDSIQRAASAGVAAIIQPGGSKRDDEVIEACDELGLAMIFTGRRHFKH
ncbi:MAG: bifunctional phosphoribosylaminoimidazolecarboxamide formyltransferase/IMP cyclohydrolase [Planctomycetales bacterium]|nr:bifunctional phosphoribosylaminoimidazolecarboxamide formyltransferase/IMP cyclohydrolase [Planctomycetales bacterium]